MAEEKKEDGEGGGFGVSTEVEIFLAIVVVVLLILFSGVLSHVAWLTDPIVNFFTKNGGSIEAISKTSVGSLIGLSIPVDIMLLIGIILSVERLKKIRRKEREIYHPHENMVSTAVGSSPSAQSLAGVTASANPAHSANPDNVTRWRKILSMVDSTNQNDWRQAIIESDIILDEILSRANYPGEDLGTKIRTATKADFNTVELAGEAHGVRNRIAHDGTNYPLSQHEAKRVINLYRHVFQEFYYI